MSGPNFTMFLTGIHPDPINPIDNWNCLVLDSKIYITLILRREIGLKSSVFILHFLWRIQALLFNFLGLLAMKIQKHTSQKQKEQEW